MRIIKHGELPENIERRKTCYKCGCVMVYSHKDIKSDWKEGPYIVCPTCGAFLIPSKNDPRDDSVTSEAYWGDK